MCTRSLTILTLTVSLGSAVAVGQQPPADVQALGWLEGTWRGPGESANVKGQAIRVWTGPVEGVMSTTFQWHMPHDGHVHFAFSVLETTEDGVILRFIHRGPDFEPFEDAPLTYRLERADDDGAFFRCLENCQAHHQIERTGRDSYRETWPMVEGDERPLVIEYRRVR